MTKSGKTGASGFFSKQTIPKLPAVPSTEPEATPSQSPPPPQQEAATMTPTKEAPLKKSQEKEFFPPTDNSEEPRKELNVELPVRQIQWLWQQKLTTGKKIYILIEEMIEEKMKTSQ